MHLNVTKNWENFPNMISVINASFSGGLGARVFNWTAWCQVWIELKAVVHSMWNSYRRTKPMISSNERSTFKRSHTNTTFFFFKDDQARRLVFRMFLPCVGPTRCRLLCKSWGFSVGKWSNTSHWDFHTRCMGWVEHRNGGTSRKGTPLKKGKFQSQSEWPQIPCDQDLKSN